MSKFTTITKGMTIADIAEGESGYNYYGKLRTNGEWAIVRESVAGTQYRIAVGASGYSTAWTNRGTTVTYGLPTIG